MVEVVSLLHYLQSSQRARGSAKRNNRPIFFDRREHQSLMALYSEQVMSGEWRDYAIDYLVGMAALSIYRRSEERPLYTVVKHQVGPGRYEYLLFQEGRRRQRAGNLDRILDYLRQPMTIVG